jgi:spore coat polysaccharide biosynthesis predicted glycosyltransferase SpsG
MRLVFRGNASPLIGSGHVMRLCSIAEEAISRSIESIFVGEINQIPWLSEHVFGLGFSQVLSPDEFQPNNEFDTLILDSYELTTTDLSLRRNLFRHYVLIADEMTPRSTADLVIHPGFDDKWFSGNQDKFYFGEKFIPIRKSIMHSVRSDVKEVRNILVFGGGTDVFNLAGALARVLSNFQKFQKVTFLSDREKTEIESIDVRYEVKPFGSGIDSEISRADVVLTTASTSSFEIIARNIPLGVVCAIENQCNTFQTLGDMGVAARIGKWTSNNVWEFDMELLNKLIHNRDYRLLICRNSKNRIDGFGAVRIMDLILELQR